MDKQERDRRMARLTPEQSGEYRRLMRKITDEAKALGGPQIATRKRLFDAVPENIDPDVALALDGVAQRDQSGPNEGEMPRISSSKGWVPRKRCGFPISGASARWP